MKAGTIKCWARTGQVAYFIHETFYAIYEVQLPNRVPTEFSNTTAEFIYLMLALIGLITFSEAIVRLIGYFAELLEERK